MKATKAEIADMKSEQARVREELAISLEELQRELKLRLTDEISCNTLSPQYITRTVIVDNFIPAEEVEKISSRAVYDEDTEQWSLIPTSQVQDR